MKKILLSAVVAAATVLGASAQDACYVLGEVNGNSWGFDTGYEMTQVEEGVFEATVDVQGYFSLCTSLAATDWDDLNNNYRLYPVDGTQLVTLTDGVATIELTTSDCGANSWTLGASVDGVKLTVDLNEYTLTISAGEVKVDENVYVVGDLSGWGFDPAFAMTKVDDNHYNISNVSVAGPFKLANSAWAPINLGAPAVEEGEEAPMPELGVPYYAYNNSLSGNMYINNDQEGEYTVNIALEIQGENYIITVSDASGIEGINADNNAPAVYYNLQGVQVENPANGLFIKKQGNKAEKVLVK